MLNYGFLDSGFYTAADKLPAGKYFARINLSYEALPEMYDEQRRLVQRGEVDFVIVRVGRDENEETIKNRYGSLFDDYEIAARQLYNNGDWDRQSNYFLLRRSDI